ncbi:MAG: RAMP superfamily CRISPR-associated protein [Egibacteraceae bacterium]
MRVTLIRMRLVTESSWVIGAPEVGQAIDRPQARTGFDEPYAPGSSLAGALRSHLRAQGLSHLMGSERPTVDHDNHEEGLDPSRLRVVGTGVESTGQVLLRQTAIDRNRASAASKTLRAGEVQDAGATVTLYLRCDGGLDESTLQALASWQPAFGGGRSVGFGRARVAEFRHGTVDLATPAGLRAWLQLGGQALFETVCTNQITPPTPHAEPWLRAEFRIVDGLLVATMGSGEREAPDAVPWTRKGVPTIEGTTLKGVLRSRAALILESLGLDVCDGAARACGVCKVCELFGSTCRGGALSVRSSDVEDSGRSAKRQHVAIDRVTGGAASGLLFSEEILTQGRFTVAVDALDGEPPAWARALLLHVFADLHDGLVGIGSRTTRGLGTVALTDPTVLDELRSETPSTVEFKELVQ